MNDSPAENVFYLSAAKNFGDAVNKTFWEKLAQKNITKDRNCDHYLTAGSIMCLANNKSIVFGSGFISQHGDLGGGNWHSDENKIHNIPKEIISVRGPKTRQKLLNFKIDCPKNYGDPLLLMPCIYNKHQFIEQDVVGVIPHFVDQGSEGFKQFLISLRQNNLQYKLINIKCGANYKYLIDEINECKYIVSSSLHGIIMGLVYNKQTIFTEFSSNIIGGRFKFYDFFESLDIDYNIKNTHNTNILNNTIKIDRLKLMKLGQNMINICPILEQQQKQAATTTWRKFNLQTF